MGVQGRHINIHLTFPRLPRSEALFRLIGGRHIERDSRAFRVTELKCLVTPWHHFECVYELDFVLQTLVVRVDILYLELDVGRAVGAGLSAALLPEGYGFSAADGKRGRRSDDFGEDRASQSADSPVTIS